MDPNQQNINQAPSEYVASDQNSAKPPIKKIVSLIIGAIVVVAIIALVIIVVLPKLSSGGDKNVNLVYWNVFEDAAPLEEAAAEFHRQNPNITVTIEKQDPKGLGKYFDRIATRIQNGSGPDVLRFHESWLPEVAPYLLPIPQELINSSGLDKKYYPAISQDLKYNGAYYGIPIHFDSLSLLINTEIFKNAGINSYPTTWDDLINVARQLTVKDENGKITQSGIALGTYDNIAHASDILSLLMVQNGADLRNLSGPAAQSATDALEFYTSFAKGDTKVWDNTLDNSKLAFSEGKLAMYLGFSWDIFQIKASNPNLQFLVVPVPHLQSRNSTIASYWVEGVSAKTKHPQQAFAFLQFLASQKTMEQLYASAAKTRGFGELYPRSDMASLLSDNKLIYPFVSQGKDAKSSVFASDTYDDGLVDGIDKYMGDAINSVINNDTSAQSAIQTLSDGVTQKMSQYNGTSK